MKKGAAACIVFAAAWTLPALCGTAPDARGAPMTLHTSARQIEVTPRYCGELVKIWGKVPRDSDVIVKLVSPRETAMFSRKGKVGPFWLSVNRVRFENVPWMYKIKSTRPLNDILPPGLQVRYQLGEKGLKSSIRVQDGLDCGLYLNELILIREKDRLFSICDTGVVCGRGEFRTSFFWPADGPPGRYFIEAFVVKNRKIVGSKTCVIDVKKVGMEAWVSRLSKTHGILYGAFAVALAIAAGLSASLAFKHSRGELAES
ncbi:MAG: TIGR02186 family protein [Acidobacteriota bacterium]